MLNILTAGCAMGVVKDTVEKWNLEHPELQAGFRPGGSVDLVRDVKQSVPCDVIVSADNKLFDDMLIPEYADDYQIFAGNKIVIVQNGNKPISSDNWREMLLKPDTTFGHHNPFVDPGGYRAVMSILLADNVEEGLSEKLMNHKGHVGMAKDFKGPLDTDFIFYYYSGAKSKGKPFAELPAVMDLSDENLADVYAKAKFAVDDENVVTGAPICHAVAIPKASKNQKAAKEFVNLFLSSNFEKYDFLKR